MYGGTKGWIHASVKGIAVEQAKYRIRANCLCLGAIDTAWTNKENGLMNSQMEKMVVKATPMARGGTLEEMAVYTFLASDEATYVMGAILEEVGFRK